MGGKESCQGPPSTQAEINQENSCVKVELRMNSLQYVHDIKNAEKLLKRMDSLVGVW